MPEEEELEKEKLDKRKRKKEREKERKGEWYPGSGEHPPPPGTLTEERRQTLRREMGRAHKGAS